MIAGVVVALTRIEVDDGIVVSMTNVDDSALAVLFAASLSFAVTLIFATL